MSVIFLVKQYVVHITANQYHIYSLMYLCNTKTILLHCCHILDSCIVLCLLQYEIKACDYIWLLSSLKR